VHRLYRDALGVSPLERNPLNCLRHFILVAGLGLPFIGCRQTFEPELPTGAVSFEPPTEYANWWEEVQVCSGLNGNFAAVHWYQVPDVTDFFFGNSKPLQGRWTSASNTITLAGRLTGDSMLVRHEELHALLHSGEHPSLYFITKCGALVSPG
jgi:hypothetical protein